MQAMTPEQNERWRNAVNPLDYLDFHALSEDGLRESDSRLASLAVPVWAIELRKELIIAGWHQPNGHEDEKEMWVPEFALRAAVALAGLAVGHHGYTEAQVIYQRLFVRFAREILHPFVKYAEQLSLADQYRRDGYRPLVRLYQYCEHFDRKGSGMPKPKRLESFSETVGDLRWYFARSFHLEAYEVGVARSMTDKLHRAINSILNPGVPTRRDWDAESLIEAAKWCQEYVSDVRSDTDLVAAAFLTALEAECPPPDWLPRA